jgi:hypothetical protein
MTSRSLAIVLLIAAMPAVVTAGYNQTNPQNHIHTITNTSEQEVTGDQEMCSVSQSKRRITPRYFYKTF